MSHASSSGLPEQHLRQPRRQHEASSHVRWHQEHEHPQRAGRPTGQTDCRVQRPLHSHRDVRAPLGRSWRGHGGSSADKNPGAPCASWVGSPWECWSSPRCPASMKSAGSLGPGDRRPAGEWRRRPVPVPLDAAVGLADLLPSLRETVWVGLSAGSMVMTPRIGEDFVGWKPPTGGDSTLGIVDFSIFPHLDHEDPPENTMADAERWAAGMPVPCVRDRRRDRHQSDRRHRRSRLRGALETVDPVMLPARVFRNVP